MSTADVGAPAFAARVSTGSGVDKTPPLRSGDAPVSAGALMLPVERTFGLAEAGAAQAASARGHVRGRLVLTVP